MATVNAYLSFKGNCEAAFNLYKSVFGGEFVHISRFNEIPSAEGAPQMTEEEGNGIMHVSLVFGNNSVLMGSDTSGEWSTSYVAGNNITLSINAESKEEADKIFNGLSAGGTITMPMKTEFWGAYFGMCTDKFGILWMVNFDEAQKEN